MEFDRITGLTESMKKFSVDWQNTWIKAILTIARDEGLISSLDIYQIVSFVLIIISILMFTTGNVSREAFKLLISLTTSKKKKDTISCINIC